jgi:hypothetical protein
VSGLWCSDCFWGSPVLMERLVEPVIDRVELSACCGLWVWPVPLAAMNGIGVLALRSARGKACRLVNSRGISGPIPYAERSWTTPGSERGHPLPGDKWLETDH